MDANEGNHQGNIYHPDREVITTSSNDDHENRNSSLDHRLNETGG